MNPKDAAWLGGSEFGKISRPSLGRSMLDRYNTAQGQYSSNIDDAIKRAKPSNVLNKKIKDSIYDEFVTPAIQGSKVSEFNTGLNTQPYYSSNTGGNIKSVLRPDSDSINPNRGIFDSNSMILRAYKVANKYGLKTSPF